MTQRGTDTRPAGNQGRRAQGRGTPHARRPSGHGRAAGARHHRAAAWLALGTTATIVLWLIERAA